MHTSSPWCLTDAEWGTNASTAMIFQRLYDDGDFPLRKSLSDWKARCTERRSR